MNGDLYKRGEWDGRASCLRSVYVIVKLTTCVNKMWRGARLLSKMPYALTMTPFQRPTPMKISARRKK